MDFTTIISNLPNFWYDDYSEHNIWSTEEEIVCCNEAIANAIADFIEALGCGDAVTGYYSPEDDNRNGEVDSLTGYWYVTV